jgi:radical SAM protein with 4Fe4S-binding SPASM domain
MANVALTLRCNRACAYCFARDVRTTGPDLDMTDETFSRTLDAIQHAGIDDVRLLGGEPTLHPRFTHFLNEALDRGFGVQLFTNGRMPQAVREALAAVPESRLAVLLNMNEPIEAGSAAQSPLPTTLENLGQYITLGHNIHTPTPQLGFLADTIDRFGLLRCVRLGLAHGAPWTTNHRLLPKDYRRVGERIAEFAAGAARRQIALVFDCGFVPCMFPEWMFDLDNVDAATIGGRCNPLPDILPDGRAVACYVLASACPPIAMGNLSTREAQRALQAATSYLRQLTIYPHCEHCRFLLDGACGGGCRGAALARGAATPRRRVVHPRPDTPPLPLPHACATRWTIPYVDQPIGFWRTLADDFGSALDSVYFPLPGDIARSGRPRQPDTHLAAFLRGRPLDGTLLLNGPPLPEGVDATWRRIAPTVRELAEDGAIRAICTASVGLAERIRAELPYLRRVASVLLDIHTPLQIAALDGLFDTIVVASRTVRDRASLACLRAAFTGEISMIVNEGCLPGCPWRAQHFVDMASDQPRPASLCEDALRRTPWLSLTGAWVLPQHLDLYRGLVDSFKLAGRVTLSDPPRYRTVLRAYLTGAPLYPNEIGAGPAAPRRRVAVTREFFASTLACGRNCHICTRCRDLYAASTPEPVNRALHAEGDLP